MRVRTFFVHADKMADRRKRVASSSHGKTPASEKKAKRQVGVSMCKKWQREFDREYQSLLWLRCDKDEANRSLVATFYCKVCRQFEDRIRGMRNFSSAWVTGTTNHRTSNVLDHAKNNVMIIKVIAAVLENAFLYMLLFEDFLMNDRPCPSIIKLA